MPEDATSVEQAANAERMAHGIRYAAWQLSIQGASGPEELLQTVRAYLAQWRPDELAELPMEVGATAIEAAADIPVRAVLAARAELRFQGKPYTAYLLRQMSLTLMAAAARLRSLSVIQANGRQAA